MSKAVPIDRKRFYSETDVEQIEAEVLEQIGMVRPPKHELYFVEEVGLNLWKRWNLTRTQSDQDRFVTYLCPLVLAVVLKQYSRQKIADFQDLYQAGIVRVLTSLERYNPELVVKTNKDGSVEYSKVFNYFSLVIGFAVTSCMIEHTDLCRTTEQAEDNITDTYSDAAVVLSDLRMHIQGLLRGILAENHRICYEALLCMMDGPEWHFRLSNHLSLTLREMTGLKQREINEALYWLRRSFGTPKLNQTDLTV